MAHWQAGSRVDALARLPQHSRFHAQPMYAVSHEALLLSTRGGWFLSQILNFFG